MTKTVTSNCHVDESAKGRYYIILGKDLLTSSGFNLKLSYHNIKPYYGCFEGYTSPIVNFVMYEFKLKNAGKITSEELFTNSYA